MNGAAITGSVMPLNILVRYSFPYSRLADSIRHFTGQDLQLSEGEEAGAGIAIAGDYEFDDSIEEFRHLEVLLTYSHEQFHLRHLTASPTGMALYLIGARQYAEIRAWLRKWGDRIGASAETPVRLPLTTQHAGDPEIEALEQKRETYGLYHALLMDELKDMNLLQAADQVLLPLSEFLVQISEPVFGAADPFPDIDLAEAHDQAVNVAGLTGRAVLEGLARMNEFLFLASLGAPIDVINSVVAARLHGVYGHTSAVAHQLLGLSSTDSWLGVAKLSDWAMQAPLLPFLLRGRKTVTMMELLPAWRFVLLASRFKQAKLDVKKLMTDDRQVAATLFGSLGWEDPWRIAERILETDVETPKSALTRHYFENLRLGAELRHNHPAVLWCPALGDAGHRLQAVYNIFADGIRGGSTGKLAADDKSWALVASLVDDAMADTLMMDADFTRAFQYARVVSDFFRGNPSAGFLVGKSLVQCVGQPAAKRIIDAGYFTAS